MKKNHLTKQLLSISLAGLLASFAGSASASGFQLFQYNGASVGDANAGGAAIADDASTNFTNAAGLVRLKRPQIVVSANQVLTQNKFTGMSSLLGSGAVSNNGSGTIPSLHYGSPINDKWSVGFSATVPFGNSSDFPSDGFQRLYATKSTIQTINLSPSLTYKFNDKFSFGAGFDAQRMSATLNQVVRPGVADIVNEASGWGYGWHAGVLYQFTPATRVGLSYRSQVSQSLSGTSTLNSLTTGAPLAVSNALTTNITLPAMTTLSIYHDVTSKWALMASVNYTQWNSIQNITLNGLALAAPNNTATITQNYSNTWRASVGTAYAINDKWLVRAGVGYDQTPTNDAARIIRLPDNDRWLVAVGARFRITKQLALDMGWTHIFIKDASINNRSATAGSLTGNFKNSADVIGAQLTYDFM
jgi:long-chain fatty acid transport protein